MSLLKDNQNQSGNALFLILIAVALFAALGYAVTKSERGTGDITKEESLIAAGRIAQYSTLVATTANRMFLNGQADATTITWGSELFGMLVTPCTSGSTCIWASDGGGLTYDAPPDGVGAGGTWSVIDVADNVTMDGIGTVLPELIFMSGLISEELCTELNRGQGISGIPANSGVFTAVNTIDAASGEPFFCFDNTNGQYWYAHVIAER